MSDIERLKADIFNGVLDHGHVVQFIGATVANGAPRAYTVGRTMLGRPELAVTGLELQEAHDLLDELVRRDEKARFAAGSTCRVGDLNVRFEEAEPLTAVGAYATFGQCELLQAVWSDGTGRRVATQPRLRVGHVPLAPTTDPYGDAE